MSLYLLPSITPSLSLYLRCLLGCLAFLCATTNLWSQIKSTNTTATVDSTGSVVDSIITKDSTQVLATDSITTESKEARLGIKISKDALPSVVTTHAKDSAVLMVKQQVYHLYGDTKATYENLVIQSGKLTFQQKDNVLWAVPTLDTAGKVISLQEFIQEAEQFTYDTLKYNFKSKRAIVRNAKSKYGDAYVTSEQVKRNADGSIYGARNYYTTCELDHPHFAIKASKIKVVPNRVIASSMANLEIMEIPTPLILPFGMFPIKQGQRSGFILPSYTMEARKGLGLQRGGYYFAINDHFGLVSQLDFFSKGSWATYNTLNYATRYRYSGNLSVNYGYNKTGEVYDASATIEKSFNVNWTHQVDPKARPGTNFSAQVNFGTTNYNRLNTMDMNYALNNQYGSTITYSKSWAGKPYSLSVALRHNQNSSSGNLSITLPEINFNLGQFSPFQRKVVTGSPKWYEKISVNYSVSAINKLNTYDSLFSLNNIAFNDMDNAIKHTASIQATYNILRFFNLNINIPYNEYWNTKQMYIRNNHTAQTVDSTINHGFFTSRDVSVSASVSTRIYGMKLFKKGKIAGIRHVMTPSIGASYIPSYSRNPFDFTYENYDFYNRLEYKSPYAYAPLGGPPPTGINQGLITLGINNTLQMKVRSNDSIGKANTKNVNLIDAFSLNTNYNMFADSNQLSPLRISFRTSLFSKINISGSATYTPYRYVNGLLTKDYLITNGGGLAKLKDVNFSLSTSFRGEKANQKETDDAIKNNDDTRRLLQNGGINDYYDFGIPWDINISAGLSITRDMGADTFKYSPNFTFNGGFNLTDRWKVNMSGGLQFQGFHKIDIATTQFNISRDLHCWQMSLNLVPFGYYRSFNFLLQVKSSVLQDLKLTRRKSYFDNY
jgi:hypothetical protein